MVTRPFDESSRARGCTTDSELMLMVWWPASSAESAIMMDEEKFTGALGPEGARGRIDCRLLEDIVKRSWFAMDGVSLFGCFFRFLLY